MSHIKDSMIFILKEILSGWIPKKTKQKKTRQFGALFTDQHTAGRNVYVGDGIGFIQINSVTILSQLFAQIARRRYVLP